MLARSDPAADDADRGHVTVSPSPQVMTPGLYYYYSTELAFYWSLVFSQFTDIKRKVRGTGVVSAPRQQLEGLRSFWTVTWSWRRARFVLGPSAEALCARPQSCDHHPTGLIALESHVEMEVCLQKEKRCSAAVGLRACVLGFWCSSLGLFRRRSLC